LRPIFFMNWDSENVQSKRFLFGNQSSYVLGLLIFCHFRLDWRFSTIEAATSSWVPNNVRWIFST
jgi:hypothetical protein